MSFRIQLDDDGLPSFVCETATEAVELAELLKQGKRDLAAKNGKPAQSTKPSVSKPQSTDDKAVAVFDSIGDKAKKLLRGLLNYPQGIEAGALSKELGFTGSGIGGILGSVSKAAKAQHFDIEQLVKSEVKRGTDNRSSRWLTPMKLLNENRSRI